MKYRKKHAEEEIDSEGSWAISYGDMITLLLSFFVIFFSADAKQQKVEKMNRHLSFEIDLISKGDSAEVKDTKLKMPVFEDINVKAHTVGENLVVTFGNQSFFQSGHTEMRPEAQKVLEAFVEKYLPYAGTYQLSVKGFTDKKKVLNLNRKYQDNLELSVLRGVSTMRVLQKLGIPLQRMEIAGVGEMKSIERIIPINKLMTQNEINSLSRTIVLVIKPESENLL